MVSETINRHSIRHLSCTSSVWRALLLTQIVSVKAMNNTATTLWHSYQIVLKAKQSPTSSQLSSNSNLVQFTASNMKCYIYSNNYPSLREYRIVCVSVFSVNMLAVESSNSPLFATKRNMIATVCPCVFFLSDYRWVVTSFTVTVTVFWYWIMAILETMTFPFEVLHILQKAMKHI